MKRAASLVVTVACGVACSGTPDGSITLVTGEETDVFSRTPAPVRLVAERIAEDDSRQEIARADLPADAIDLGERPRSEIGAIAVRGEAPDGRVLVRGQTLFVQWGALESAPLQVFVQRTGELARMPSGPAAIATPKAALVAGRYVFLTGSANTTYDLLTLRTLAAAPPLPRPARSLASFATSVVVVDENGADTVDLSDGASYPLSTPAGGTFAEIAGGARVSAGDAQYVVGGTRLSGGPSARVFFIDASGNASFGGLTAPREGACATFVSGRGLIVFGGGAPPEVLATAASLGAPLPFPADATRGCGATTLDGSHVLVVSEGAPRVLDLACTSNCAPVAWPGTLPLVRAEAHALGPDAAFVLGDDAAGVSHAYRVSATELHEVPLRVPRSGARLVLTSNGGLVVAGGGPGLEHYLE